jgi:hypothetical protein
MSDIQFETDNQFKTVTSSSIGIVRAENKMAEWMMRRGMAKTQVQAQLYLLGIAAAAAGITIVTLLVLYPRNHSGQVYKGPIDTLPAQPVSRADR